MSSLRNNDSEPPSMGSVKPARPCRASGANDTIHMTGPMLLGCCAGNNLRL